ncbi:unnamed protein product [Trichogramma brassicae]|uniref:RanBP2-type domain-containing protein n=1 Tax=Trichogramma brassicae TaxID=86971 RepID=A0A6H5I5W7_9HYME|nr:unnamed protein product [Trichogramma brassicae]
MLPIKPAILNILYRPKDQSFLSKKNYLRESSKHTNWVYWISYISVLERYAALAIQEQGNSIQKPFEALQAVYNFSNTSMPIGGMSRTAPLAPNLFAQRSPYPFMYPPTTPAAAALQNPYYSQLAPFADTNAAAAAVAAAAQMNYHHPVMPNTQMNYHPVMPDTAGLLTHGLFSPQTFTQPPPQPQPKPQPQLHQLQPQQQPQLQSSQTSFVPHMAQHQPQLAFGDQKKIEPKFSISKKELSTKPVSTEAKVSENKLGGFSFTSTPILQQPKTPATPLVQKKPEETSKPSPFATFTFGKSSNEPSKPGGFNFGEKLQEVVAQKPPSSMNNKNAEQKKPLSEMFKPAAGSWECQACYTVNPSDKTNCLACQTASSKQTSSATAPAASNKPPVKNSLFEQFKPAQAVSAPTTTKSLFGTSAITTAPANSKPLFGSSSATTLNPSMVAKNLFSESKPTFGQNPPLLEEPKVTSPNFIWWTGKINIVYYQQYNIFDCYSKHVNFWWTIKYYTYFWYVKLFEK